MILVSKDWLQCIEQGQVTGVIYVIITDKGFKSRFKTRKSHYSQQLLGLMVRRVMALDLSTWVGSYSCYWLLTKTALRMIIWRVGMWHCTACSHLYHSFLGCLKTWLGRKKRYASKNSLKMHFDIAAFSDKKYHWNTVLWLKVMKPYESWQWFCRVGT